MSSYGISLADSSVPRVPTGPGKLRPYQPKAVRKFDTTPVRRVVRAAGADAGDLSATGAAETAAAATTTTTTTTAGASASLSRKGTVPLPRASFMPKQPVVRPVTAGALEFGKVPPAQQPGFAPATETVKPGRANVGKRMPIYAAPKLPPAAQFHTLRSDDVSSAMLGELGKAGNGRAASARPRTSGGGRGGDGGGGGGAAIHAPQRVVADEEQLARVPKRRAAGVENPVNPNRPVSGRLSMRKPVKLTNPENSGKDFPSATTSKLKLKDYETLAFACRRAGKAYQEGLAYYNIAVLHDNATDYKAAIKYYKKYAGICRRMGNVWGEALAYNNIGVDYMYLGDAQNVNAAIDFHERHVELTNVPGKFIGHCNLGLCYTSMPSLAGAAGKANQHFRQALRFAVRMSNKAGEAMVVANMAVADRTFGDADASRATAARQRDLAHELNDAASAKDAEEKLGRLATTSGDFGAAKEHFQAARNHALTTGDSEMASVAVTNIGVAEGNLQMAEYMGRLAGAMQKNKVAKK